MTTVPEPPAPPADAEEVVPGLFVQWLYDRRIVVFIAHNVSHQTIDAWVEVLQNTLKDWPEDRPFLSLYEMSFPEATLTPYMRSKLGEVIETHQNLTGRTAAVVRKTFLVQLVNLFLRGRRPGIRQRQIFYDYNEGLEWLKEMLNAPVEKDPVELAE